MKEPTASPKRQCCAKYCPPLRTTHSEQTEAKGGGGGWGVTYWSPGASLFHSFTAVRVGRETVTSSLHLL